MTSRHVSPAVMEQIAQEFRSRRSGPQTRADNSDRDGTQRSRTSARFRFGNKFELDTAAYELRFSGEPRKLSRIPMKVLHLLLEQPGRLVHRHEIVQRVWGDLVSVDTDRNINETIRRIRRALDENPEEPRYLQTVHGIGYRFIAPVIRVLESPTKYA